MEVFVRDPFLGVVSEAERLLSRHGVGQQNMITLCICWVRRDFSSRTSEIRFWNRRGV